MLSPSGIYLRKHAKRKYDAILKSACRLFLKNGYTRTSMDAIANAAKVSKQTVYSYFTNKDILFCQMIEAECVRHTPSEGLLESPNLTPEDALFRIGRGFIDMINSPRGLAIHRLVMGEAERHPRIAKLFFDSGPLRMQRLLTTYLERQVQAGNLVIDNLDNAATYFFSLVRGRHHLRMSLRMKPVPGKKELDDHVRDTIRVFYKIYGQQQSPLQRPA